MAGVGQDLSLRLTDPELDFWVEVRLRSVHGSWLAVSDLASSPEVAASTRPDLAILFSLWPLGETVAGRMAMVARGLLMADIPEGDRRRP